MCDQCIRDMESGKRSWNYHELFPILPWVMPRTLESYLDPVAEYEMEFVRGIVANVRNIRTEAKINPKQKLEIQFHSTPGFQAIVKDWLPTVLRLANASSLSFSESSFDSSKGSIRATAEYEIFVPHEEKIQDRKPILEKDLARLQKDVVAKEKQLQNEAFLTRAPKNIVDDLRTVLASRQAELEAIQKQLKLKCGQRISKTEVSGLHGWRCQKCGPGIKVKRTVSH
jgi:valyl-tRNA synthetase